MLIYVYTIVICLVGNKFDRFEDEQVEEEDVKKYANEKQIKFKYVSALNGKNTNELFQELVDDYVSKGNNSKQSTQANQKLSNKKHERKFRC